MAAYIKFDTKDDIDTSNFYLHIKMAEVRHHL